MRVSTIDCTFANDAALAESFAETVAANLRAAIDARGRALIGLSGGSTPREFLKRLSNRELDWSRVTVTLCDDRWVPPTSERSNEHLLRETLLRNNAAKANFVPLYVDSPDPESALSQRSGECREIAVAVRCDRARHGIGRPYGVVISRWRQPCRSVRSERRQHACCRCARRMRPSRASR